MTNKDGGLHCSFCGKSQREVKKLIAGPNVYVCDECIQLCNDIIAEEVEKEVTFGKILEKERLGVNNNGPWAVSNKEGQLIAVYDNYGEKTKPTVVLVS